MAITLVQSKLAVDQTSATNSTSFTATLLDSTPTTGNLLTATLHWNGTTPTDSALTGGVSGSWTRAKQITTNRVTEIWYGYSDGSAPSVTVSYSKSSNIRTLRGQEWAGAKTSSPLDGAGNSNSGTSTTPATGDITITDAGSAILAAWTVATNTTVASGPTNSFTFLDQSGSNNGNNNAAYRIPGATGTYSTGCTNNDNKAWSAAIVAFLPAGGFVYRPNMFFLFPQGRG